MDNSNTAETGSRVKKSVKTDETAKAARPKVAEIVFSIQENRLSRSCQMPQTSCTEHEKRVYEIVEMERELTLHGGEKIAMIVVFGRVHRQLPKGHVHVHSPPLRLLSSQGCRRHPVFLRLSQRPPLSLRRRLARPSHDPVKLRKRPGKTALSQSFC